ncbi:MAG: MBL fold metallo-hydrolase [Verrucomicrobiales bacterium]|nr:MBL fold metallo-hydrolase [Verrucomicrobiales bacterium]
MSSPIPIEDFFEDIIAKAMRGHHISISELVEKTGVSDDVLQRLIRGEFCDEPALIKVAKALKLDPQTLTMSASKVWRPRPVEVSGVAQFNTPYRDMRVNAFLIWDPDSLIGAAFDTGTNSSLITAKAAELGVTIETIFLTHTHNDHIADLDSLKISSRASGVWSNEAEPWPGTETFSEGKTFQIGALKVSTLTTSGHSPGGTTYFIEGLERSVAIAGDALFAGSMGGGICSFEDAWRNNRKKILTLPDETVICPGHGPMTSVGEEKRNNPFFAGEFRS